MADEDKKTDKKSSIWIIAAIAVVAIIIVIAIAGFVLLNNGTATSNARDYTLKASVNKDCTITPWVVGAQKGFFNESGVNFTDIGEVASTQRSSAFVSGQFDVLDADPQDLINQIKAGMPVIAVAQSGDEPTDGDINKTHMQWLVLDNSPIHSIQDLNETKLGHKPKIGVTALGICADTQNNAWFRANNISRDVFEYVVIPDPQQEQALRQGLIDVAILHPPFYFAAQSHGGVRALTTSQEAFGSAGGMTLLAFRADFIKEHPETVRKFIQGYKDAEVWSNNNRGEAGVLTASAIGLDKAAIHYYSSSGKINETELQIWIDQLVADGNLKPGEFKPSDLYTTEFSDAW